MKTINKEKIKLIKLLKSYMQKQNIWIWSLFEFQRDFNIDIFNFKKGHILTAVYLDNEYEDEFISDDIRWTFKIPSKVRKEGILKEVWLFDTTAVLDFISDKYYSEDTLLNDLIKAEYNLIGGYIEFISEYDIESFENLNKTYKKKIWKLIWKKVILKPIQTYTEEELGELIKTLELVNYLSEKKIY